MGPTEPGHREQKRPLPADFANEPLKYLPPRISLSESDLALAAQYELGDFSGGYITSQIAFFRRGPTPERNRERREKFRRLRTEVDRCGLTLPDAFVELVESDDAVARLRHDTIWLRLPDELAPLPSDPDCRLFLIFSESQGGGYWYLLLARDGGHAVAYSELYPFGIHNAFLPGYEPDLHSVEVYQCAGSFPEWIVNFFAECEKVDRKYEKMLREHPGM
jgi:hypothetical protein